MRMRRERARRRRVIRIVAIVVVLAMIVVATVFGVRLIKHWKAVASSNTQIQIADYSGSGDEDVTFTVKSGQGVAEIAENLVEAKIVKSTTAFTSAVSSARATLYPGMYSLKTHMKASEVVKILSDQTQAGGFAQVRAGSAYPTSSTTRLKCRDWTSRNSKPS